MERLREHVTGVAAKYLSAVDAMPVKSNQHEIGSNAFARILGNPGASKVYFDGLFLYFNDEDDAPLRSTGCLTWYDTRLRQLHRGPEYRLYYQENPVTARMQEGDFFIVAVRPDDTLLILVCPAGSTSERQLRWLFNVRELPARGFEVHKIDQGREISIVETIILQELGIEVISEDDNWLDLIMGRFGSSFPKTGVFSEFARDTSGWDQPAYVDPDSALMAWMEQEEMLFRTLEKHIVQKQLDDGFSDVEHFIGFSLSVQNRRKSRVGHALEHHLAAVFSSAGLEYGRQVITENRATADFLFPGQAAYNSPGYPSEKLVMLASKSTCKDRWRQVLAEAHRIPRKHLFTLEPAISVHQTTEMEAHNVQLVIPSSLTSTYVTAQQDKLLNLSEFIESVRFRLND